MQIDRAGDVPGREAHVLTTGCNVSGPTAGCVDPTRSRRLAIPSESGSAKAHSGVSRYLTVVRSQIAILL